MSDVFNILKNGFDDILAKAILDSYQDISNNYILKKWKPSELDSGHFVEAVRRAIDLKLSGSYKPFNKSLPRFDEVLLKHYENQSGDESYRLLIPRVLKAIYNIRNKRGVAHISDISPNEMDATFILYSVKWILAELIRLNSHLHIDETQSLIDKVVERQIPLIWKGDDFTILLDPRMKVKDQILILLYDQSPKNHIELQDLIEYKNTTQFRRILKKLHEIKLLYYHPKGICIISPNGLSLAEKIIENYKMNT